MHNLRIKNPFKLNKSSLFFKEIKSLNVTDFLKIGQKS